MTIISVITGAPYQDHIVLAGQVSPGLAAVRGCSSPRNWDVQKGYGLTGATVIFTGEGLATFDVDIFAWEPEHFTAWEIFARLTLVNPPIGARPTAMFIQHPQVNDPPISVSDVVVTNVTQWEQGEEGGLWARTISFLQYRKAKPALIKPLGGVPGDPLKIAPPIDPEQIEIQRKSAEIAKLAG